MTTFNKGSVLLLLSLWLISCSGGTHENAATVDLSARKKMYYEQYMVQGRVLYQQNCANCHQEDGKGLGRVIPPLAKADYMLDNMKRTTCIIKYGIDGSIFVNGEQYKQAMPANAQLTDIEVAQILTFIGNSWSNEKGYYSVNEVSKYLEDCSLSY